MPRGPARPNCLSHSAPMQPSLATNRPTAPLPMRLNAHPSAHHSYHRSSPPPPPPLLCLPQVAQQYVTDPLLVLGRKCHLRLWVLVTAHCPMRAYLHK